MQICADTFNKSTASLYYCASKVGRLQRRYASAVHSVFGCDSKTVYDDGGRIGSRGLVKIEVVEAGAAELHRKMDQLRTRDDKSDLKTLVDIHNALLAYVLLHWTLITMHRPTDALFEVCINDIDCQGLLTVLSDKRIDAAHFFRLAALSELLGSQISAYLGHLLEIREKLGGTHALISDVTTSRCCFKVANFS